MSFASLVVVRTLAHSALFRGCSIYLDLQVQVYTVGRRDRLEHVGGRIPHRWQGEHEASAPSDGRTLASNLTSRVSLASSAPHRISCASIFQRTEYSRVELGIEYTDKQYCMR